MPFHQIDTDINTFIHSLYFIPFIMKYTLAAMIKKEIVVPKSIVSIADDLRQLTATTSKAQFMMI